MILGEFNFGDHVYIDSKDGIEQLDVYCHELAHYSVTQSSLGGILMIALKQVTIQRNSHLSMSLKELHDSSIVAQEMTAMYAQYMGHLMSNNDKPLTDYYVAFKKSDYYKKYCINGFDTLIQNPQCNYNGQFLIIDIAIVALSIDFTLIDDINWLDPKSLRQAIIEKPLLYNCDYRYKRLINATLQLIREQKPVSMDSIVSIAGIQCAEYNYSNIYDMITRLCLQLAEYSELKFDDLFGNVIRLRPQADLEESFSIDEMCQRVIPKALNTDYKYPPKTVELVNNLVQTATVILHDKYMESHGIGESEQRVDILLFHHSIPGWHYYVQSDRKKTINYLQQFPGEIVSYSEDYDIFRQEIPLSSEKRVFFYYDGQWQLFMQFMKNKAALNIYVHQVNEYIYCVFATKCGRDVFFTIQAREVFPSIMRSVTDGVFTYINLPEKTPIDNCFYYTDTDWCKYEDVIAATLNICRLDNSDGAFAMGRRINLDAGRLDDHS